MEFDDTDPAKSRARYAYAVVTAIILIVLCVRIINTHLESQNQDRALIAQSIEKSQSALNRLNALEVRDITPLFSTMALMVDCHLPNFSANARSNAEMRSFTTRWAEQLTSAGSKTLQIVRPTDIVAAMRRASPPPFIDQDLQARYLKLLYAYLNPTFESNSLAYQWIAAGLPRYGACDGGGGGGGAGEGAVVILRPYTNSSPSPAHRNIDEYDLVIERLKNVQDMRASRAILVDELHRIRDYESKIATGSDEIIVYGLRLQLTELVIVAALALCALQAVFFLYWNRENIKIADIKARRTRAVIFPLFGGPTDPLSGPLPRSFAEILERIVWATYLVLPLVLIATGALTRYDFTESKYTLGARLFAPRLCDTSLLVDYINFVALAFMLCVMFALTSPTQPSNRLGADQGGTKGTLRLKVTGALTVFAISAFCWFSIARPYLGTGKYWGSIYGQRLCMASSIGGSVAFPVICFVALLLSFQFKRRYIIALSGLGLLIFCTATVI